MRRVIVLVPLRVLTACARFTFQEPTAQLVGVEVAGLGFEGGTLRLLLNVHNPNTYDLRTTRIEVGIDLEGTHFGEVALAEDVALPARATTPIRIPLAFTWGGVGAGARGLLGHGTARYGLTGRLTVGTPLGDRTVSVGRTGEVTLGQLMR
jgi:LEA14-like dessication related protein